VSDLQQPDGIADDSHDLPDPARAAERVNEFLAWYGDGRIDLDDDLHPPLFARDLQALTNLATGRPTPLPDSGGAVMAAAAGLDRPRVDLASVIFEAWRRLGPKATPQNASGEIARAVLDAGWALAPDAQWGWRLAGHPDAVTIPASEATARKQAELDPDTEVVRRPVGEWEVVTRG
jgi:hypothetical protein